MSRQLEWLLVCAGLSALVSLRSWPFLAWSGVHFDSDQAVVGLMAKHLAEGRAFPLFFYGQTYMLGVEAWTAAPFIALLGTSVAALKLPLLFINLATVILLTHAAATACHIRPLLAAVAALPLALPAAGVAARVIEANGGNVEPWLYVVLLWTVRDRAWPFGLILGLGFLHREFTAYAAVAMLTLHAIDGRLWSRAGAQHWSVISIGAFTLATLVHALRPFANVFGPGTSGDAGELAPTSLDAVSTRLCFVPELWPARIEAVLLQHLPLLYGGVETPLAAFGVRSDVVAGRAELTPLVLAMIVVGLAFGGRELRRSRFNAGHCGSAARTQLGWYLVVVGLASTSAYTLISCADIGVHTLRYNLLGLMIPVGALVLALGASRKALTRAGMTVAAVLWGMVNAADILALTREYRRAEPADLRQIAADVLVARGVPVAWSDFRLAYHITFLANERVRVAAVNGSRIHEYFVAAQVHGTPTIADVPCQSGQELAINLYLCPP